MCSACVESVDVWLYIAEEGGAEQILQKSHRGFFTGILVLSGGFVAIIMFYFSTTETIKALIYLTTLISLHGIMLLATGVALIKISQVRLSSYVKLGVKKSRALKEALSQSYEMSLVIMGSHSYLLPYTSEHTPHNPSQRLVLDLPTPEGWKAKLTYR